MFKHKLYESSWGCVQLIDVCTGHSWQSTTRRGGVQGKSELESNLKRSAFCRFQGNVEISVMDTNRDLGIMSHVGHLQRTPEFVRGVWL